MRSSIHCLSVIVLVSITQCSCAAGTVANLALQKPYTRSISTLYQYGKDNAPYLMEMGQDWFRSHTAAAYVNLGVGNTCQYKEYTRQCVDYLGWRFEGLQGDVGLIERMLNGYWRSDDFLIIEPGYMTEATNREDIMASVPAKQDPEQVATSNVIEPDC